MAILQIRSNWRSRLRPDRALRLFLLVCLAPLLAAPASAQETPVDFTIAFIGDQGSGSDARAVLTLILDEGADAVLHQGDFDYNDDPAGWEAQIDAVLGPDFPYFASVGNHDEAAFYGSGGYQEVLVRRMERLGIPFTGDLGVKAYFHYQGIFIVLTAPDIFGDGDGVYAPFIRDALASDDSIWSLSSWHKNMADMQVGGKSNATGWGVYEESRRGGAIIATGHEHSYSRTHLLSSMENQTVASTEEPLRLQVDDPSTPEDEGRSFVFVSGLGGASIRDQERDGDWWASVYTSTQNATDGALFGVFNFGGDPHLAYFYFKDVDGNVVDEFLVRSPMDGGSNEPTAACNDAIDNDGDGQIDFPDDLGCDDFTDGSELSADLVCDDGLDNDGDGPIDWNDPDCDTSPPDPPQTFACNDGLDNDGDGMIDSPADPGCDDGEDDSERSEALVCDDGLDNDGDGLADNADRGCKGPKDPTEYPGKARKHRNRR